MVRLKIRYDEEKELRYILELVKPHITKWKETKRIDNAHPDSPKKSAWVELKIES